MSSSLFLLIVVLAFAGLFAFVILLGALVRHDDEHEGPEDLGF